MTVSSTASPTAVGPTRFDECLDPRGRRQTSGGVRGVEV